MPSPERHQWQVAAQAADRGVDLTARKSRQKRQLFRSLSEATSTQADTSVPARAQQQQQQPQRLEWSQDDSDLEMLRVHSRVALLPSDGGMV